MQAGSAVGLLRSWRASGRLANPSGRKKTVPRFSVGKAKAKVKSPARGRRKVVMCDLFHAVERLVQPQAKKIPVAGRGREPCHREAVGRR